MADEDKAAAASRLLASSWTSAAAGYDIDFVPRFAPWTADALAELTALAPGLPRGGVWCPMCGPGQELPALAELFEDRVVMGVDLAEGMIEIAGKRVEPFPLATVRVGDAAVPPDGESHAALLSVFGLQQLPEPPAAFAAWCADLAPGGVAVVCYWPSVVEEDGPWARYGALARTARAAASGTAVPKRHADGWEAALVPAATAAGCEVLVDRLVQHEMAWPSPEAFFDAMTRSGPWHAHRLRYGDGFVDGLRDELLGAYPVGEPLVHAPKARLLVVVRRA